ncbi:hypothetical protein BGX23_007404 [Mortierella sp. AD031]|nr:hypothetical protein BGX23_007404 [Mortierella sp. AD031]
MHGKAMTATTISGTGIIGGPLDLSRLEASNDYYIRNDDDLLPKRTSLKGSDHVAALIKAEEDLSNSNNSRRRRSSSSATTF